MRLRARRLRARTRKRWRRWRHGYAELPPAVQINVASVCNLRCRMCPYLEVHVDPEATKFMSEATFAALLPSLAVVERIHFSGSGEPLLNKQLLDFMRAARRRYPRKQMDLTTNATLLDADVAAQLVDLGLSKLHVSIDGARSETVEAIRRRVDFARVVANLETLDRLKRARGSGRPVVMINCSVGHGTYRELVEVVRLAKRIGAAEVQLLEMMASSAADLADDLFHNLAVDGGRVLREAIKLAERDGIQLHLPTALRNACLHPTIPHLGEDGEVYPCCFLDYDGFNLFGEDGAQRLSPLAFGNAARNGFAAVWHSAPFRDFRDRTARGDFSAECRACHRARLRTSDRIRALLQA